MIREPRTEVSVSGDTVVFTTLRMRYEFKVGESYKLRVSLGEKPMDYRLPPLPLVLMNGSAK